MEGRRRDFVGVDEEAVVEEVRVPDVHRLRTGVQIVVLMTAIRRIVRQGARHVMGVDPSAITGGCVVKRRDNDEAYLLE